MPGMPTTWSSQLQGYPLHTKQPKIEKYLKKYLPFLQNKKPILHRAECQKIHTVNKCFFSQTLLTL